VTLLKEANGFILNRLQYALLMEAWRCVEDGICSPEDCDTAVSQGLGLRWSFMGPFQTIDLNAPDGVKDYCERLVTSLSCSSLL
jgi:L-gulonate 3-dehydrogenase